MWRWLLGLLGGPLLVGGLLLGVYLFGAHSVAERQAQALAEAKPIEAKAKPAIDKAQAENTSHLDLRVHQIQDTTEAAVARVTSASSDQAAFRDFLSGLHDGDDPGRLCEQSSGCPSAVVGLSGGSTTTDAPPQAR